jgi:rhodanese-related sulfurtransferase
MKELSKTNRLTIVVVAIVVVFAAGLLTLRKPEIKYSLSPEAVIEMLGDSSNYISPERLQSLLEQNDGKSLLVDIRNSIAFDKSHIQDARNIPVRELFTKQNLTFLRSAEKGGQTILIYGESPRQANGPWILLRQSGFNNIKLVNATLNQLGISESDTLSGKYSLLNELPLIDTAALKKLTEAPASVEKPVQAKKTVVPVKTTPSSGGGC